MQDPNANPHLPFETLSRVFTLGCHDDRLPWSPIHLPANSFSSLIGIYKRNTRLPKPFAALTRQVCKEWNAVVEMNSHLWSIAISFIVRKRGEDLGFSYNLFIDSLNRASNIDFIVYMTYSIPDLYDNALVMTPMEPNLVLFLQLLRAVSSKRVNISALFLEAGSFSIYKCFNSLSEDNAIWPNLEVMSIGFISGRRHEHTAAIAFTEEEQVPVKVYLPYWAAGGETSGRLPVSMCRPSLVGISYQIVHPKHLENIPPGLLHISLKPPAAGYTAWQLFTSALETCHQLQSAEFHLPVSGAHSYLRPDSLTSLHRNPSDAPGLTRLRYLQIRVTITTLIWMLGRFHFHCLEDLDIDWLPLRGKGTVLTPPVSLTNLRLLILRSMRLNRVTNSEILFLRSLHTPRLTALALHYPHRKLIWRMGDRIQAPREFTFMARGSERGDSDMLFDLDLTRTEQLTLDYRHLDHEITLPRRIKHTDTLAFPSLSMLEVLNYPLSGVFMWTSKFILPNLRTIRGCTRQSRLTSWSALVIAYQTRPGIQNVEELTIALQAGLCNISQIPALQSVKDLRLQISNRGFQGGYTKPLRDGFRGLFATPSSADPARLHPFPNLERLVFECQQGVDIDNIRWFIKLQRERFLKWRKAKASPLVEMVCESGKWEQQWQVCEET
jgi:hypothetical protein